MTLRVGGMGRCSRFSLAPKEIEVIKALTQLRRRDVPQYEESSVLFVPYALP